MSYNDFNHLKIDMNKMTEKCPNYEEYNNKAGKELLSRYSKHNRKRVKHINDCAIKALRELTSFLSIPAISPPTLDPSSIILNNSLTEMKNLIYATPTVRSDKCKETISNYQSFIKKANNRQDQNSWKISGKYLFVPFIQKYKQYLHDIQNKIQSDNSNCNISDIINLGGIWFAVILLRELIKFERAKEKPLIRDRTLVNSLALHDGFKLLHPQCDLPKFYNIEKNKKKPKKIKAKKFHKEMQYYCQYLLKKQQNIVKNGSNNGNVDVDIDVSDYKFPHEWLHGGDMVTKRGRNIKTEDDTDEELEDGIENDVDDVADDDVADDDDEYTVNTDCGSFNSYNTVITNHDTNMYNNIPPPITYDNGCNQELEEDDQNTQYSSSSNNTYGTHNSYNNNNGNNDAFYDDHAMNMIDFNQASFSRSVSRTVKTVTPTTNMYNYNDDYDDYRDCDNYVNSNPRGRTFQRSYFDDLSERLHRKHAKYTAMQRRLSNDLHRNEMRRQYAINNHNNRLPPSVGFNYNNTDYQPYNIPTLPVIADDNAFDITVESKQNWNWISSSNINYNHNNNCNTIFGTPYNIKLNDADIPSANNLCAVSSDTVMNDDNIICDNGGYS